VRNLPRRPATAVKVNDLLKSFVLPTICAPAALARLKNESPAKAALGLLSEATALSEDDLRRETPRVDRGRPR